ncbi:hypothetical protein H0H87_000106 [Tephrocybe sp. NHM501043]|nr:hypothetical protein H0H87_000106 [Tephrocybe sp. NHM501043]
MSTEFPGQKLGRKSPSRPPTGTTPPGGCRKLAPNRPTCSIFQLTASYKADTFEKKVNLGVGAYRDDDNKPWVLPVVQKASERVLKDTSLDHEYLPITGLASFTSAAAKLILGASSAAIGEGRTVSVQTISGTGANHLGALFLSRFYKWNGPAQIYLSKPTWANHHAIFKNVGIEPVDYPYYDPQTIGLDFRGFIGALENAPERSVFLLHACAHNPTGVDPTEEQWKAVAEVMLAKQHYAFFDCAYQGFASGDLDRDAWAVRYFVERGVGLLVCQSFAKNAGLYGERVGALHVVAGSTEAAGRVKSQLSVLQRSEISNPPTYGARVVSLILNDETLFEEWKEDIRTMAGRIIAMRKELYRLLTEELKTPGSWEHIVNQIGMFSDVSDQRSANTTMLAMDPDERPHYICLPPSPDVYYTAPSSPFEFYTPPTSPLPGPAQPPALHIAIPTDDPFPEPADVPADLALDDAGLSTLEKIYLFARSKAAFHRIYISHALPDLLHHVASQDAVDYVLPLLESLATDEGASLPHSLYSPPHVLTVPQKSRSRSPSPHNSSPSSGGSSLSHCALDGDTPTLPTTATVPVQAFTPILGTLLLSNNPLVGAATRRAIVDLLLRLADADQRNVAHPSVGPFNGSRRQMLRTELLQQVVIGMSRLDMDTDDQPQAVDSRPDPEVLMTQLSQGHPDLKVKSDIINPYFPLLPPAPNSFPSTPAASFSETASSASYSSTGTTTRKEPSLLPPPEPHHPRSDSPWRQEQLDFARALSPQRHPPALTVPGGVSIPQDSVADPGDPQQTTLPDMAFHTPYEARLDIQTPFGSEDGEEDEQAAVGRLSSMSLMAAVTASGTLDEDTKEAFVKEVVRVSQDSIYWVRREASFALGALAKVVSEEIVVSSLLPLFNTLRGDAVWHVRHSALFALPALLSRLPANHRRSLAVETITTLAKDESSAVQCGVLEALGEVMYTFFGEEGGPPEELVDLFLGRREDRRLRDGQQELLAHSPERPLICAFNYPAVALTLGQARWGQLRGLYLELSQNRTIKVRRSLAASVGELAKIIGTENAERDLVSVWWDGIRCEDEEVRTRAVESLPLLIGVVDTQVGDSLMSGLLTVWDDNGFRGWRERVEIAHRLTAIVENAGSKGQRSVAELVQRALVDAVTAVREAGVRTFAGIWTRLDPDVLKQLRADIGKLAQSTVFKQRMM